MRGCSCCSFSRCLDGVDEREFNQFNNNNAQQKETYFPLSDIFAIANRMVHLANCVNVKRLWLRG